MNLTLPFFCFLIIYFYIFSFNSIRAAWKSDSCFARVQTCRLESGARQRGPGDQYSMGKAATPIASPPTAVCLHYQPAPPPQAYLPGHGRTTTIGNLLLEGWSHFLRPPTPTTPESRLERSTVIHVSYPTQRFSVKFHFQIPCDFNAQPHISLQILILKCSFHNLYKHEILNLGITSHVFWINVQIP